MCVCGGVNVEVTVHAELGVAGGGSELAAELGECDGAVADRVGPGFPRGRGADPGGSAGVAGVTELRLGLGLGFRLGLGWVGIRDKGLGFGVQRVFFFGSTSYFNRYF